MDRDEDPSTTSCDSAKYSFQSLLGSPGWMSFKLANSTKVLQTFSLLLLVPMPLLTLSFDIGINGCQVCCHLPFFAAGGINIEKCGIVQFDDVEI